MRATGHGEFRLRPYRAPRWLRGRHAQTVAGRFLRPAPGLPWVRERVDTPDGDFVDLDWGPDPGTGAGVVLVLHGLEGSARRSYVQLAFRELLARGLRPVGLNFRSCSGELNRTARLYHSGETEDVRYVAELVGARAGDAPLGAIGFSLGGNVLLKYLGEEGVGARIRGAVAVSVPFDLAAGCGALEGTLFGRYLYTPYFMRKLRRKTAGKSALLTERCDVPRALRARTLREFDDAATAPLHGFRDATDYYERCSSAVFLARIRVPTLLLQALDDPFLPREALPTAAALSNPWLLPGFVETGGHTGFLYGPPWRPRFWAEEEAARYLAAVLTREPAATASGS
jgi:uncharacterized protein